jgi:hypothetical protein
LTGVPAVSRENIEKWFNRQGLTLFVHGRAKQRSVRLGTWVGWLLVALFLAPTAAALLVGEPVLAMTIAGSTVTLVIFVVFLLGTVIAIAQWAIGEIRRQMVGLLGVLARTLPFLFVGIAILFLTAEVWQVATNLRWQFLLATLGVFLLVGTLCLATRLVAEVRSCCVEAEELSHSDTGLVEYLHGMRSSMRGAAADGHRQGHALPPETMEKVNIGLLLFLAQNLQILGVSVAVGVIFVTFGLFAIPPETAKEFFLANHAVHPVPHLPNLEIWGQKVVVTKELLKVTGIVVGFSYLSFVFFAVTRDDYVEHFLRAVRTRIADALAVRHVYLTTLWAPRRHRVGRGRNYRLVFDVPAAFQAENAAVCGAVAGQAMEERQMDKRPDGGFSHQVIVASGERYRYRQVIDGVHRQDQGADEHGRDNIGGYSVVAVPPMRLESR